MQTTMPEDVGLSSKRLERITSVMEDFVKDNRLPGILTLVQRHGEIAHLGKFGCMDIEAGKPMQEDTLFRIYSMTKPITSVAVMLLLEEGRLSLTDSVSSFIPAFANTKVCVGTNALGLQLVDQQPRMNLHHLLTHTAGLSYGSFFDSPVDMLYGQVRQNSIGRDHQLQQLVEDIAAIPLVFQPGTQWRYGLATDVLGYIVQVVADMPLADFFKDRIFKPLGMVDTDFYVPPEKTSRLAQIYQSPTLYDVQPIPPSDVMFVHDITRPTSCPLGGAGLVSTLADYLRFCECLLNKGSFEGERLISRKTVEWMTANHIPNALMPIYTGLDQRDYGFGLGFRVTTDLGQARRLSSVGEYGWDAAGNSYFWIDPAEDFIGIMMTQHLPMQPYPVNNLFRNLAYQAIID